MPTKLPRITITVRPETKAILDQLEEVADRPASGFISEMLDEAAAPYFIPIIEAMRLAKEKKTEAWDVLGHALAGANANVAQLQLAIHEEKQKEKRIVRRKRVTKKTT